MPSSRGGWKIPGRPPWVLDRDPDVWRKLLIRTATEHTFSAVYTVISLPSEEDDLTRLVDELSGDFVNVQTVQVIAEAKCFNPRISVSLRASFDSTPNHRDLVPLA